MKKWILINVIFILFSCQSDGKINTQRGSGDIPLSFDNSILRGQLDNGLTYYIKNNTEPENRISLRLLVNAGSVLEEDDQKGLAHFLEHMAFNGSEHFEKAALVDFLESIGMDFGPELNAYTSFDETVYMLEIPAESVEVLDNAFLVLSDWAKGLTIDPSEVEKERGVVLEEWRLGRGASGRIRDKQFPVLFGDSKYAERMPIGDPDILRNAPAERLKAFYDRWYVPSLMAVIAVGDVSEQVLEEKIKKYFSYSEKRPAEERPRYTIPTNEEIALSVVADPEAQYQKVELFFKEDPLPYKTRKDYRRNLTQSLLYQMFNKRIDELMKKGDNPFLYAGGGRQRLTREKELSYFYGYAAEGKIPSAFKSLLEEVERIRRFGVTPGELGQAKDSLLRDMQQYYDERNNIDSKSMVSEIIRHHLYGEPIPGIEEEYLLHKELIPGISLDEVNELAGAWLAPEGRVLLVSGTNADQLPTKKELLNIMEEVVQSPLKAYTQDNSNKPLVENLPPKGKIIQEEYVEEIDLHKWTLENGACVYWKKTDFKDDEILLRAFSPGGTSLVSDKEYPSSIFATAFRLESGLGGFSAIQLENKLTGRAVELVPYIEDTDEGFSGNVSPKDLETLLQLIYLNFTQPVFDSDAIAAYQTRLNIIEENRLNNPEAAFFDRIKVLISGDHLRGRPVMTKEILSQVDPSVSQDIFRQRFDGPEDFAFFLVGNLDPQELKILVEKYIASLPIGALPEKEMAIDRGLRFPSKKIEETMSLGLEPKSRIHLAFGGDFEAGDRESLLFEASAQLLRLKLRERIREDLGGTYGVNVTTRVREIPLGQYSLHIDLGCEPGREDELSTYILAEMENIMKGVIEEEDLVKIREGFRRDIEVGFKENSFWVNAMVDLYENQKPWSRFLAIEDRINSISIEDLQEISLKYWKTEEFLKVILTPENGN